MAVGIYILKNKINHKCYVGQSWNIEGRLLSHSQARSSQVITRAINKYGWENFDTEIILVGSSVSQQTLNLLECQYIELNNSRTPNGYNVREGGNNGKLSEEQKQNISNALKGNIPWNKGIPWSNEVKQKLSESHKGYKWTEEAIRKRSKTNTGIKRSEATRQKQSNSLKGRISPRKGAILSDETKQKLSMAHKGKPKSHKGKKWKLNLETGKREWYVLLP